jgi:hypothetical protein
MKESTIIFLRTAILFFQIVAAIVGILLYKKWKNASIEIIILYLVIIVLAELMGYSLGILKMYHYKNVLYKYLVLPFEFFSVAYFYYSIAINKFQKKSTLMLAVLFTICWLIELLFLDNISLPFSSFSYSIGNLFFLIFVFSYGYQLLQTDEFIQFYKQANFWISFAWLLFYLLSFPYYLLFNTLVQHYYKTIYLPYQCIVIFLNYIMYSIFIATLIWTKPK